MFRLVLIMLASFFFFHAASAADQKSGVSDEKLAAIKFEKLVNSGSKLMMSDYPIFQQDDGTWFKRRQIVSDLTYDIKRTDSLLSPVIGFVHFTHVWNTSPKVASKEDAMRLTEYDDGGGLYFDITLKYSYMGGAWKLNKAYVNYMYRGEISSKFEFTDEDIRYGNKGVKLQYWLPALAK